MKNLVAVLVVALSMVASVSSHAEEAFDVLTACKKDCPKASNNEEAHKCAEKLGRLNKEFRKSHCWEVNEEYEAARTEGTKEQSK